MKRAALPPLALLATGALVGSAVPIMAAATRGGVHPLAWLVTVTSGASLVLLATAYLAGAPLAFGREHVRYYASTGFFSIALPNVVLFAAVGKVGASVASLAYALPPLLTLAVAALAGMERATPRRALGVGVGLAATAAAVVHERGAPGGEGAGEVALLLVAPASIAVGNVLRTRLWPSGAPALANAAGSTSAGALLLAFAFGVAYAGADRPPGLAGAPAHLAAAQAFAMAGAMMLFFWLQRAAGPLYTSFVGYVATAAGLASAPLLLGEAVSPVLAGAVLCVVASVAAAREPERRPEPRAGAAAAAPGQGLPRPL